MKTKVRFTSGYLFGRVTLDRKYPRLDSHNSFPINVFNKIMGESCGVGDSGILIVSRKQMAGATIIRIVSPGDVQNFGRADALLPTGKNVYSEWIPCPKYQKILFGFAPRIGTVLYVKFEKTKEKK